MIEERRRGIDPFDSEHKKFLKKHDQAEILDVPLSNNEEPANHNRHHNWTAALDHINFG